MIQKPEDIIKKIKKFCKEQGMKQYEFARLINCPDSTLNRWLRRKQNMGYAWKTLINSTIDNFKKS